MTKVKKENQIEVLEPVAQFKGYTIEEIRYQRALLALRKEFCKAKLMESIHELNPRKTKKQEASGSSKWALAGKIASKVLSNLNTLDYVLMGISLFGTARKGVRLLKGKKKK